MKTFPNIDYTLRPKGYWDDQNVLRALLRNVKGTQRRRMIIDFWKQGRVVELQEELLKDTLSDEAREHLGKLHPAFMGGEFLPDYNPAEVEIARIELASTTADVISIRAARDPEGIRYRIVDEYETEFEQQHETSRSPLTLGQLIQFIEESGVPDLEGGLALTYNNMNAGSGSRVRFRHFTTVSSQFYPQLYDHFEHVFEDWVRDWKKTAEDGRQP